MWMKMGSRWKKAKTTLGRQFCVGVPQAIENRGSPRIDRGRSSDVVSSSFTIASADQELSFTGISPSSHLQLSDGVVCCSKRICAICLTKMAPGKGQAIFTAECSHDFHFCCIVSNVKHGNLICPVCRATWKEVPCQNSSNSVRRDTIDAHRRCVFDDDEVLDDHDQPEISSETTIPPEKIEIKTYTVVSEIAKSDSIDDFTILIHLKAPPLETCNSIHGGRSGVDSRSPIDLVTVLDVSGSMAGTKLALLKRAMSFVIQNLGPSDRLSVVAFSSTARRLIPLHRMTEPGRQQAIQAVSSLTSSGGTNVADGLEKGARVIHDRKFRNPVSSIVLLSDGHDTYSSSFSFRPNATGGNIPVHAFGFGSDHDADLLHSIAESSGGTFSFIETEFTIQAAFAQCIGGLLSVVARNVRVGIEVRHRAVKLVSIKAGSYKNSIADGASAGSIDAGDLYAEEERDFLVTVSIPATVSESEMSLLRVRCFHRNPFTEEEVEDDNAVRIHRPDIAVETVRSMEVARHTSRLRATEAMSEARKAAENGDIVGAVAVLRNFRRELSETTAARAGDRLSAALDAELREMEERTVNRNVYEASGRAYLLSGLSSHSFQRATARGDSTEIGSRVQVYQTQAMSSMINRSRTFPHPVRPASSSQTGPEPR